MSQKNKSRTAADAGDQDIAVDSAVHPAVLKLGNDQETDLGTQNLNNIVMS